MKPIHLPRIAVITALALLPELPGLCAEETPPELTLNRAIELAIQNDLQLLPKKNALQLAQMQQDAPIIWRDPELRFNTGIDLEQHYLDSALRFYPSSPWQVKADRMANASLTAIAEADCQISEMETATAVYRSYRELQCLEAEILLASRSTAIKKEAVALSNQRASASLETSSESLRLRWELRETEQAERTAHWNSSVMKSRLAAQTGLPADQIRTQPLNLSAPFTSIRAEPAAESALANRPDLHLLKAQLQQADSQLKQVQAEQIPWLTFVQTGYSEQSDAWDIQVAVSIPVFSRSSTKKQQAATAQFLRQTALTLSEQAVSAQATEAEKALERAVQELADYREEQADLIDATRREIKKLQELAPAAPLDRIRLEEWIVKDDYRQLQLIRAIYSAQADLLFTTGKSLPLQ